MEELTKEELNWATGTHLASFLSILIPFGSIIGPMIVWLVKKNDSDYIDYHGKEAINFNISTTIYAMALLVGFLINLFSNIPALEALGNNASAAEVFPVLARFLGWLIPLILLGFFCFIMTIVAAISANGGNHFKYPLTIRFIR